MATGGPKIPGKVRRGGAAVANEIKTLVDPELAQAGEWYAHGGAANVGTTGVQWSGNASQAVYATASSLVEK